MRSLNLHRRHLIREQKQTIIRQQLKDTPDKSDRQIAKDLGVDHKTVPAQRGKLQSTGEIPQFDKIVGVDGKARHRPAKPEPKTTRPAPGNGVQASPAATSEPHQPAPGASQDKWSSVFDRRVQKLRDQLPKRSQGKFQRNFDKFMDQLNTDFQRELQQAIDAQIDQQLQEQRTSLIALIKEAQAKDDAATKMLQGITAFMTAEEYNLIRGLLHPDRHPGEDQDRYTRAFEVFKRLKETIDPLTPTSVLRARGWAD